MKARGWLASNAAGFLIFVFSLQYNQFRAGIKSLRQHFLPFSILKHHRGFNNVFGSYKDYKAKSNSLPSSSTTPHKNQEAPTLPFPQTPLSNLFTGYQDSGVIANSRVVVVDEEENRKDGRSEEAAKKCEGVTRFLKVIAPNTIDISLNDKASRIEMNF